MQILTSFARKPMIRENYVHACLHVARVARIDYRIAIRRGAYAGVDGSQELIYTNYPAKSAKLTLQFFTDRITTMQSKISRRAIVKGGLIAGAFIPALGLMPRGAVAADLPPLNPSDPTAKALGFVTDSSKVDAAANPTHKATQKCGNCAQYQGTASAASAGCNIFAGHSVPQAGWCKVWAQKPGA
jgi:High potential iron-sulfur protein